MAKPTTQITGALPIGIPRRLYGQLSKATTTAYNLNARMRDTSLIAEQRDTTLSASMRDTSLISEQRDTSLTAKRRDTSLNAEQRP